ncbi:site-specific DNA-methyltransferase [Shewanella youngdeokensis]|uniref:site-specific DNA-methyltransferase (adenine-specific) n=1 Tax=Shewanella youngdeokensis TaxID=2999068 RepID=A0ABZ0JZ57_9GAMM|nr:DNA methyltransferase [Shewanella sp. DAU334]
MSEIDKITGNSPEAKSLDITQQNIEQLKQLFPDVFSENKIDFEALKAVLGEEIDDSEERYNFTWNGKTKARQIAQTPSTGTLRPCKEESVNWDTTENLFIEGDNLEVLKLLQKSYHKQVKMIYIDPPYNTGKDFVYPDDYADSISNYLTITGQQDIDGLKLSTNAETSGRYHTEWLNMLYPRLKLARNLLSDDGAIFISIDDNEIVNLRKLCDEVFGEDNFLSQIIVQSNKRGQTYKDIAKCHEYILIYYKTSESCLGELDKASEALPHKDEQGGYELWELRNRNPKFGRHNRPNLFYPIYVNADALNSEGLAEVSLEESEQFSIEVFPLNSSGDESCWRWGKEKLEREGIRANPKNIWAKQKRDGNWNIYEKSRKSTTKAKSIWADTAVISEQGTIESGKLGLSGVLDFPKPIELVKRCIKLGTNDNDLIMDFFSGSGTTFHSMLRLNSEDSLNRRCISIQLPEPTYEVIKGKKTPKKSSPEAFKQGFDTIADVCKERMKRAIKEVERPDLNFGFKAFRLDETNIRPWDADFDNLEQVLQQATESIKADRSSEDVLYEIFLKYGYDLTTSVETEVVNGKTVFVVGAGALIVCLDDEITGETVEGIAKLKEELDPETTQVVFKDAGFADSNVKTNAIQILKQAGIADVKSI